MESLLPLRPQLTRQINLLSHSAMRLSLMSVVISNLSRHATAAAVLAATSAHDMIGLLEDGSIGIFAIRTSSGPDGGVGVEERFLPRLQASLHYAFTPNAGIKARVWFRSAHRWAAEVFNADDLINILFDTQARTINLDLTQTPSLLTLRRTRWAQFSQQAL